MDGRQRESAAPGDMFLAGQTNATARGRFLQPSAVRLDETHLPLGGAFEGAAMDGSTWGGASSVYPGDRKSPTSVTHRNPPGYMPGVSYKDWQPPGLTIPGPTAPRV